MVKPEGEVFVQKFVEYVELDRELGKANSELDEVNKYVSGDLAQYPKLSLDSPLREVRDMVLPLAQIVNKLSINLLDIHSEANERFLGRKVGVAKIPGISTDGAFSGYWQYRNSAVGTLTELTFARLGSGFSAARRPDARLRSMQNGFVEVLSPPKLYENSDSYTIVPMVKVEFIR